MNSLQAKRQFALAMAMVPLTAWAVSCVSYPANPKLERYDPSTGYRFERFTATPDNSDEVFVVLTFSGGGTRAAAFSYGVLEALRNAPIKVHGRETTLLQEVDVISSVSGGSFTAAYYGLFGDQIFTGFEGSFLTKNVEARLAWSVANPLNWWALASADYSRIDLAAEIYDDLLFKGKTLGDLAAETRRPYVIINSTDMSTSQRVEFTQEFFDLLHSDVGGVPIARAVAASSAFPLLLCPLTLNNYHIDNGYVEPEWVELAMMERETSPSRFDRARMIRSYLSPDRPYLHLLDGGLSDNIGLRGPWLATSSTDTLDGREDNATSWHGLNIRRMMQREKDRITKLVVIIVNARTSEGTTLDKSSATPSWVDVASAVGNGPMGNYSSDTVQLFQQDMDQWSKDQLALEQLGQPHYPVTYLQAEINFDGVMDPQLRATCNSAGTNYSLSAELVQSIRNAARDAVQNSESLQDILQQLRQ